MLLKDLLDKVDFYHYIACINKQVRNIKMY